MAEKKKYTEQEISLRGVTNQPIDPARGDTPQARSIQALRGIDESVGIYYREADRKLTEGAKNLATNTGGFLRDSAVTAAATGALDRNRDLPSAGFNPAPSGPQITPLTQPKPPQAPAPASQAPGSATPRPLSTPATAGAAGVSTPQQDVQGSMARANNVEQLRKMGLTNAQINMPAVGGGDQGRLAAIRGGSNGFVNLGNYGQEGQGNIYGRSSAPGGRMDTFVGAGPNAGVAGQNAQGQVVTGGQVYNPSGYDPSNPYAGVLRENRAAPARAGAGPTAGVAGQNAQGQVVTGGQVYNPSGYDPSNPYAGVLRENRVAPARAGNPQFPGTAGLRQSELRKINAQANRAFNQALESGMNTKAATRIAENIRAGGGLMVDQDKNDASRYSSDQSLEATQYASDSSLAGQALREQGAMTRAQQRQMADQQKAQFEMFADQFVGPDGKRDKARLSRVVQNSGGLGRFMNASPEVQQKLMTRGNALAQLVDNANKITAKDGTVYSTFEALSGGAKIPGSDATIMDAIRSGNISLLDAISGADKLELGDGTLVNKDDFFGDFDEGTLVGMSPEDRRDMIEWIDGRGE